MHDDKDRPVTIKLLEISIADLEVLAESGIPNSVASNSAEAALPPAFVAQRALGHLKIGKSPLWCSAYYITRDSDGLVVGSCGFKDEPSNFCVEIGYGISPDCRKQGFATAAVGALLELAFTAADVREVLAQINPKNEASIRVAKKLGFEPGNTIVDSDNETLVQWFARTQPV
jgi:RimJ/RimL family protein N-acetyltransferase